MVPQNQFADTEKVQSHSRRMRLSPWLIVALTAVCGLVFFLWSWLPDPENQFHSGLTAVKKHDWQSVRECSEQLLANDRYRAHGFLLQGFAHRSDGQFEKAFVAFNKAGDHVDTRETAYQEAASMLYEAEQYSQTIALCQQVLQWNPKRQDSLRLLAAAYYDIGAMAPAISTLQRVIDEAPDDHRPHYMQASILQDFEHFDDAVLAYEQAAKRITSASTVRDEVLAGWGACLVRLRRPAEALEVMQTASNWPEIETQRAVALFALRQPEAALQSAESALQQCPSAPEAVAVAAQCYELSGETERGLSMLKEAAALHPLELELQLRLAEMLSSNGQPEAALKHRQIAAEISNDRRDFSHKQQALVSNENNAALRFEIAQIAERLGKIELAGSWLRAAVGMSDATEEIRTYRRQFHERHPPERPAAPVRGH